MPIGQYRLRIVLQKKTVTQDEEGNLTQRWKDWRKVWAKPVDTRNGQKGRLFEIRYCPGIPKVLRVCICEEVLEVKEVLDLNGRHQHLILMCQEVSE